MTSTETATSRDKLDTVRKLLAKAEGASTPEEADAYTAKAVELISRHGIDEALLANDQHRDETPTSIVINIDDPYSHRKSDLLCWIGHALNVQNVCYSSGRRMHKVVLYGFASDLERVELLYTSLLLQATGQLVHVKSPDLYWETTTSYRHSWLQGFASRVSQRIRESEARAAQAAQAERDERDEVSADNGAGTSVALVLVERKDRVQAYLEAENPKLRKLKKTRLQGTGGHAGRQAGDRADIGAKRVGGQRTAIG